MILILLDLNPASTSFLCSGRRPAWWKATALETHCARRRQVSLSPVANTLSSSFDSSGSFEPTSPQSLAAVASAFLRLLSKIRIWAFWDRVSLTRASASSLPPDNAPSLSGKTSFPLQMTPSLRLMGLHSLVTSSASSQSASSGPLATVAERPMICIPGFSLRSLVMVISRVGPRFGSFRRCISSTTRTDMSPIQAAPFLISESAFSEVAMIIWFFPRRSSLRSKSPVLMPTLMPRSLKRRNASYFSVARALRGTMYRDRFPWKAALSIASSARRVFPAAVGMDRSILLPSRSPRSTASACGG
ncbi:Uncharacterised protein [uncultured archaeon]|nr:Uncharacterised protein [uncultured archaeon]